ncbi:MAG: hypothetical protein ACI39G_03600 [Pseudoramibacter sp.]
MADHGKDEYAGLLIETGREFEEDWKRFYYLKESYNKKLLSFRDAYLGKYGDDGTFHHTKPVEVHSEQEKNELIERCYHVFKMQDKVSKLWLGLDDAFAEEDEEFNRDISQWTAYMVIDFIEEDILNGYMIDVAVDLDLYQEVCDLYHKIMTKYEPMADYGIFN